MTRYQGRALAAIVLLTCSADALLSQANWRPVNTNLSPQPRSGHIGIADEDGLYVFGGRTVSRFLDDTWKFDGTQWQEIQPSTRPAPRADAAGTWDSSTGRLVVFGGRENGPTGNILDDTWEFRNGNWFLIPAVTRPPARIESDMIFDARSRQVVLFGGRGGQLLGDTWTLDKTTWQQVQTSTAPSPRQGHAMAYDKTRSEALLFGGRAGSALGDTWKWDGTNWTLLQPGVSPPARWGHALTFDRARDRYVLFGGVDGTQTFDSTWEFDGTTWISRNPAFKPRARDNFQHHFVPLRNVTLGFGGDQSGTTHFGDLLEYQTSPIASFETFGTGCPGSAGRPTIFGSQPWTGEAFTLSILALPPLAPAFLNLGLSNTTWGSLTLPFPMATLGAPGCSVLVDPTIVSPVANTSGRATLVTNIANDPRLVGVEVYMQAWTQDNTANALGVATSEGGRVLFGAK